MRLTEKTLEKNNIELVGKDEVFTQIPKWNKYFISNYGRLLHKNTKGKYKIVNPSITKGGYLTYSLSKPARMYKGEKVRDKNGKTKPNKKCMSVQKFVAICYVKNPYPKTEYSIDDLQVHHKDKNPLNNYYKNLMWLCKNKNNRKDHDFVENIKRIAIYNPETAKYHSYRDIDMLLKRVGMNILELIDTLKYSEEYIKDGKWKTYKVGKYYVGVQYYKERKK